MFSSTCDELTTRTAVLYIKGYQLTLHRLRDVRPSSAELECADGHRTGLPGRKCSLWVVEGTKQRSKELSRNIQLQKW